MRASARRVSVRRLATAAAPKPPAGPPPVVAKDAPAPFKAGAGGAGAAPPPPPPKQSTGLGTLFALGVGVGGAGYGYYYWTQQQSAAAHRQAEADASAAIAAVTAEREAANANAYLSALPAGQTGEDGLSAAVANVSAAAASSEADNRHAGSEAATPVEAAAEAATPVEAAAESAAAAAAAAVEATPAPAGDSDGAPSAGAVAAPADEAAAEQQGAALASELTSLEAAPQAIDGAGAGAPAAADGEGAATAVDGAAAAAASPTPGSGLETPFDLRAAMESARAHSNTWLADQMAALLRDDLEREADAVAAAEAEEPGTLRERLLRVSHELSNRGKYEALQLKQLVEDNDRLWMAKFEEFAASKADELQREAVGAVEEIRRLLDDKFKAELDHEKAHLAARLADEAEAALRARAQELGAQAAAESDARKAALRELAAHVAAADELLTSRGDYERVSRRVHRVSAAVLALARAVDGPSAGTHPATQEVAALTVAAGDDPVLTHALALLPAGVHAAGGVPSLHQLQARFEGVSRAGRRAALTPENSGILGAAVGTVTSALLLPSGNRATPAPAPPDVTASPVVITPLLTSAASAVGAAFSTVRGWVTGVGGGDSTTAAPAAPEPAATEASGAVAAAPSSAEEDSPVGKLLKTTTDKARDLAQSAQGYSHSVAWVQGRFADAQAAVDAGDLQAAVDALAPLQGFAGAAVADWAAAAEARLATDRALAIARARAALLAAALY